MRPTQIASASFFPALVVLLAGCERPEPARDEPAVGGDAVVVREAAEAAEPGESGEERDAGEAGAAAVAELAVITPEGIGPARAGMTVGEIRAALDPELRLGDLNSTFMVDLVALPVVHGRDTLLHLVFPADETLGDGVVPLLAVTDHAGVLTVEGVGPGIALADAAARYGAPRLRFNAEDEMREYATFPDYDHPTVWFRVAPGDSVLLAGRYDEGASYGETDEYDGTARIMMVMVRLRRQ
jgi:hypothetical protein